MYAHALEWENLVEPRNRGRGRSSGRVGRTRCVVTIA